MKDGSKSYSLLEDVRYAQYRLGACNSDDKTIQEEKFHGACTGSTPGSDIIFNIQTLLNYKVTLAEMVGIIIHEHSHHFLAKSQDDHGDYDGNGAPDYLLQIYMKNAYMKGQHEGKTYTVNDGLGAKFNQLIANYSHEKKKIEALRKKRADRFCKFKKFFKSVESDTEVEYFNYKNEIDFSEIILRNNELMADIDQGRKGYFFTKITCVH